MYLARQKKKKLQEKEKTYPGKNAEILHTTEEATPKSNSNLRQVGQPEHFISKL